jgi:hypothetical protein
VALGQIFVGVLRFSSANNIPPVLHNILHSPTIVKL